MTATVRETPLKSHSSPLAATARAGAVYSPTGPMDLHALALMFTFDGEEGEELCLGVERTGMRSAALAGGSQPVDATNACHRYLSVTELIGHPDMGVASHGFEKHDAAQAKAAQLLTQWLSLPTTETLMRLLFSSARRSLPISRDVVWRSEMGCANGRSLLPVAPRNTRTRWSVSGATPRVPPLASPAVNGVKLHRRRKSEPAVPTTDFKTPPGGLRPPNVRLSFDDSCAAPSASGSTPRRGSGGLRSPGSGADGGRTAAEVVYSPLSYFGTQPGVSSRFLHVPQGDGGVQALFEHAAGGPGLALSPEDLLTLAVDRLDLPRAVARVVVKRALVKQKELSKVELQLQQKENAPTQTPKRSPAGAPLLRSTPSFAEREPGATPTTTLDKGAPVADGRVGFPAFFAVYGRHRPEENDRIRLFRLIKRDKSPWVLKEDVRELVWAVVETHVGLEFLRDSAEFLDAYVNTTTLRILWALSGQGTERIALQHWRHSTITEVLFQLDDEADINLARDYFAYNHFYVIWCIFWELDEDEDSRLTKEDLLRYGQYGLTSRAVDRLWALRRDQTKEGMAYDDFVYFLLSEEDKQATPALQYWFHMLDVDGDGCIDKNDMWYFYEDMKERLLAMNEEVVAFDEVVNEFMDIVHPEKRGHITLTELKRSQLGYNVVSALTNVRKYIAWEGLSCEKAAGRASTLRDTRDWDLFADSEYRRLVESDEDGNASTGDKEDADQVEQAV